MKLPLESTTADGGEDLQSARGRRGEGGGGEDAGRRWNSSFDEFARVPQKQPKQQQQQAR